MLKNKNFQVHLGLLLVAGLAATTYSSPALVSRLKRSATKESASPVSEVVTVKSGQNFDSISQYTPVEATYLYGQSNLREQIGKEYLVFKVEGDRVTGAIYYPRSEFSCFYGKIANEKMNLKIIHPYDRSVHPYSIPLASSPAHNFGLDLEGYQQITTIGDNDRRILNTCLAAV